MALVVLVIIAVQLPPVQHFLTKKGQAYLEKKLKTKVVLGGVYIGFPKDITLKDIYIEDRAHDTLLYSHELSVNLNMWELLHKKAQISSIYGDHISAHIYRIPGDTTFNYTFISQAFSSGKKTPQPEKKDTSGGFDISLSGIELHDIYFTFKDPLGGNDIYTRLGYLNTRFNDFDLSKSIYDVKKVDLENTAMRFVISKKSKTTDTTQTPPPKIGLDNAVFKNVSLFFNDKTSGSLYSTAIGNASMDIKKIDLSKQIADINEVDINDTRSQIVFSKPSLADTLKAAADSAVTKQPKEAVKPPWKVVVGRVRINRNAFAFDNNLAAPQPAGMDYNHLNLQGLTVDVQNIQYNGMDIRSIINQIAFNETRSGFVLKNFSTKLAFDSTRTELANLDIRTNNSHIQRYMAVGYKSIKEITADLKNMKVTLGLDNTIIGLRDVLYFVPSLRRQQPFRSHPTMAVRLDADVKGTVGNLNIRRFFMQTRSTVVAVAGTFKGLPNAKTAYYDLNLNRISTTRVDIKTFAPASALPASVNIPSSIVITGYYRGTMRNFSTKANVNTTDGRVFALATMRTLAGDTTYTADVSTDHLQLGHLLVGQDSTLGPLTVRAQVRGTGLNPKTMTAAFQTVVEEAVVKGYRYNNFKAQGTLANQVVNATAEMDDTNLNFTYNGAISIDPHKPTYNFVLNLKRADLYALHFSTVPREVKGMLVSNIVSTGYDDMQGTVGIKNVLLKQNGKKYPIDSLLFASVVSKQKTDIRINSDIMSGYLTGHVHFAELPEVMDQYFDKYFMLPNQKQIDTLQEQDFKFALQIHNTDLLTDVLVPGLDKLIPGTLQGDFNSRQQRLNVTVDMPLIVYNGMKIDSLNVGVHGDARQLKYAVNLNRFDMANISVVNPGIDGGAANDTFNVRFTVKDDKHKNRFMLAGQMSRSKDVYRFMLLPEGVIFNYQPWTIHDGSYVEFGGQGFYAHDFTVARGDSMLSIDTKNQKGKNVPIALAFKNFSIACLSTIAEGKEQLFRGLLNGDITLKDLDSTPVFVADMKINGFGYKGDTLGDIAINANNQTAQRYTATVKLTGNGNNLIADGYYSTANTAEPVNATLNIQSLKLHSVEPYLDDYLTDMSGEITGNLAIKGSVAHPSIIGQVNFPQAAFTVNYLQNHFHVDNEKIVFENRGIYFPSFTLLDSAGNKANVNGYVYAGYFDNIKFDLSLTAENFRVINTAKVNNQNFYGRMLVSSRLTVTGTSNLPVVRGSLNIDQGTNFNYVLPGSQKGIEKTTGIVDFIDMDTIKNIAELSIPAKDTTHKDSVTKVAQLTGVDININLTIEQGATFKVVVDPLSGDNLLVNGTGTLAFAVNPSGAVALTGRVNITKGAYQLSFYNFVKRKFDIQQGSSITWFGNPTDAQMDITAVYTAKAAPLNLLDNQLAGETDAAKNQYRQKLPVNVLLNLTGQLMQPQVQLSIDLPNSAKGKTDALVIERFDQIKEDQNETNKQAFALLVMGSFLAEDPLNNSSGGSEGGLSSAAASSVSDLLGMELNRLANNYIKGVDINVSMETDQQYAANSTSSEETSKLNVGVSKAFLNDRLTVSVGSNIDVYGQEAGSQNVSEIVGDVNIEYKLTPQGQLLVRVFRNEQYQGIITGEIIETGIGLIFMREYNRWSQLLKAPKHNNTTVSEPIQNETP